MWQNIFLKMIATKTVVKIFLRKNRHNSYQRKPALENFAT